MCTRRPISRSRCSAPAPSCSAPPPTPRRATSPPRWRRRGPAFLDGLDGDVAVLVADAAPRRARGRGHGRPAQGVVPAGRRRGRARDALDAARCGPPRRPASRGLPPRVRVRARGRERVRRRARAGAGRGHHVPGRRGASDRRRRRRLRSPTTRIRRTGRSNCTSCCSTAVEARAGTRASTRCSSAASTPRSWRRCSSGLGHRVHTYTFGFEDRAFEQRNVDVVTQFLRADHHRVPITSEVIGAGLAEFADVYSLPVSQPHYLLHTLVAARAARADGFDRVFTGDGCDAAFLGFPTVHRRATGVASMTRVPVPVVRAVRRLSSPEWFERHGGHVWRMAQGLLDEVEAPASIRGHLPFTILGAPSRARLRTGPPPAGAMPVDEIRARLAAGAEGLDPARRAFHGHGLTGQSATKVDGAVAATGLAQWSPYLAPEVRAFALSLPSEALRPADGSAGDGQGSARAHEPRPRVAARGRGAPAQAVAVDLAGRRLVRRSAPRPGAGASSRGCRSRGTGATSRTCSGRSGPRSSTGAACRSTTTPCARSVCCSPTRASRRARHDDTHRRRPRRGGPARRGVARGRAGRRRRAGSRAPPPADTTRARWRSRSRWCRTRSSARWCSTSSRGATTSRSWATRRWKTWC